MRKRELVNKINRRKLLINFFLKFVSPTNAIMVLLSKNLDKHIFRYQHYLYKKHHTTDVPSVYTSLSA